MIYRLEDAPFDVTQGDSQGRLAKAYAARQRPLCLCKAQGVPMYIAQHAGRYLVKRMPNSADSHAVFCEHYDPPAELSGFGEVAGAAIQERDNGEVALRFAFALQKVGRRTPPSPVESSSPQSAKADGSKLGLLGLLHYLFDQAGFTRWSPAMEGKRTWAVVRRYLLEAGNGKVSKGLPLGDLLYIPESFRADEREAIADRRRAFLARMASPVQGASKQLRIVIGEVKEFAVARYGFQLVVKHLPDFRFHVASDLHRRASKRFERELALSSTIEGSRLLMIATFGINPTGGTPEIEELAFMAVTSEWLPFETSFEYELLSKLVSGHRRFVKGLRYNLGFDKPMATAVLTDTGDRASALYVSPGNVGDAYQEALAQLTQSSSLLVWKWNPATEAMPTLPSPHKSVSV